MKAAERGALHGARTARPASIGIKQNRALAEASFLRVGINKNWCVPHGRGGIQRSSWRGTSPSLGGGFQHLHLHASAGPRTSPRESLHSAQDVGGVPSGRMCRRTFVYMTARAPKRSTHGIPETAGARAEERSIKHAKYACACGRRRRRRCRRFPSRRVPERRCQRLPVFFALLRTGTMTGGSGVTYGGGYSLDARYSTQSAVPLVQYRRVP